MRLFFAFVSGILVSCTTEAAGVCQNPVHDACTAKAQDAASELAKIAAQRQTTPAEMTTEFVNACEGQLQADLDQTLASLEAIVDAGVQDAHTKDSP